MCFDLERTNWRDPQVIRRFFEEFAKSERFDSSIANNWRSVSLIKLLAYKVLYYSHTHTIIKMTYFSCHREDGPYKRDTEDSSARCR